MYPYRFIWYISSLVLLFDVNEVYISILYYQQTSNSKYISETHEQLHSKHKHNSINYQFWSLWSRGNYKFGNDPYYAEVKPTMDLTSSACLRPEKTQHPSILPSPSQQTRDALSQTTQRSSLSKNDSWNSIVEAVYTDTFREQHVR